MTSRRVALRQLPRAELLALAEEATDYLEEAAPLRWDAKRDRHRFERLPPWLLAEKVLLAEHVRELADREARTSAA